MALFEATGAPERLQFFNGQRLFASDLEGLRAFHQEMRRLHLSSLHEAGIGNGFAVYGEEGDREVRIGSGYALDDLGREIVLVEERVEPVPPVAGGADGTPVLYDLTVSYRDDDFLEEAEARQGLCGTRGVVRLLEEPVFCWVRLGPDGQAVGDTHKRQILNGRRIILARAEIRDCKLRSRLSIAQRFDARPPTQPFIACGRVRPSWLYLGPEAEPGGVPLEALCKGPSPVPDVAPVSVMSAATSAMDMQLGCLRPFPELTTTVDTSCSGFRVTPCYWARIEGERLVQVTLPGPATGPPGDTATTVAYVDALLHIDETAASPSHFVLHLTPIFAWLNPDKELLAGTDLGALICDLLLSWMVVWKGVEG